MKIEPILDIHDERVRFFRELRGHVARLDEHGLILVEGDQQVERLLRSQVSVTTLFFEPRYFEIFGELLRARQDGELVCYSAERIVMEQIVGYRLHQGVMALAKRPTAVALNDLVSPIVALEGITDPENVGSIVRSAVAFGVRSLLCDSASSDPYLRRAVRVSMGAILEMKVCYVENLASALAELAPSFAILGVEQSEGSLPIAKIDLSEFDLLVFGNERNGVSEGVLRQCQAIVEIPMARSELSSINVGAAAAIALHHLYEARLRSRGDGIET